MKKLFLSALTATIMLTSSFAVAGTTVIQREGFVIKSAPIYSNDVSSVPKQTCRTVDVPIYGQTQRSGASGADVLGGMIIGGLLGKGVTGKDDGAAAGAVLGGIISADKKRGKQQIVGYRQEQRCNRQTTYTTETNEIYSHSIVTFYHEGRRHQVTFNRY